MKKILSLALLPIFVACGGGGSDSSGSGSTTLPVANPAEINVAEAVKNFLSTTKTTSNIPSTGTDGGTAALIVRTEEAHPFVTNGVSVPTTSAKVVQFQRSGTNGKLAYQTIWKLHFDAQFKPVGVAIGDQFARYNECMTVKTKNDLPVLSSGSGTYFSGAKTMSYDETFRAAKYAHYCDPSLDSNNDVEWSVLKSGDKLYACTTFPRLSTAPRTRICQQSNAAGVLGTSILATVYDINNQPVADYKL
ncbi:hypothetical protein F2P45_04090 [Massilia sp. CCM 8733]|uniref:Lipoprotein n=1 Tax=Massilia mucilaginosa TaxID=2609282 RepID=A0ABX0NN39_9BURK|nr:hypothetical protein [Massilia mucilaginosa]NHZ88208.1 hypothetical protein [Massilia mucilaginosa]